MTTRRLFVTGTDTGVGKTVVATGLLRALALAGRRTVAMKPVASGCRRRGGRLVNADALALIASMTETAPYPVVNPYAFEPAIAPHLAARAANRRIELARIVEAWGRLPPADFTVVEGAGGWRVPIGGGSTLAAVPARLDLDVILVVAIRLGCLNHALLTAEAIAADGCRLAGWVANPASADEADLPAQVDTLREWLGAPLAVLPRQAIMEPASVADCLHLDSLLGARSA